MPARPSMLLCSLLLTLAACGPKSVEEVHALAERANGSNGATAHLVDALDHADPAVQLAASDALVAVGPDAIGSLRLSVLERHDEAAQALMVMGEIADPDTFPLIREVGKDPTLRDAATRAFDLAEQTLWGRISAGPTTRDCDHYLRWFPAGAHAVEVRELRRQTQAENALRALGSDPEPQALERFAESYPDTPAAREARRRMAAKHLEAARRELDADRPVRAIEALELARDRVELQFLNELEGEARVMLGRRHAADHAWDAALKELEAARALGAAEAGEGLADMYQERAEDEFNGGDLVGGMVSLDRAEREAPDRKGALDQARKHRAQGLLQLVDKGGAPTEVAAGALLLAGRAFHAALFEKTLSKLQDGDVRALKGIVTAAKRAGPGSAHDAPVGQLLGEALLLVSPPVRTLLNDRAGLALLLDAGDFVDEGQRVRREEVSGALDRYVLVVRMAQQHDAPVSSPVPTPALLEERELGRMLLRGGTPLSRDEPDVVRAQLLRYGLQAHGMALAAAREDPARLVAQLVGVIQLPGDLLAWRVLANDAAVTRAGPVYARPLSDGSMGEISSASGPSGLVLVLRLRDSRAGLSNAVTADALTALFGSLRLLMAAAPDAPSVAIQIVSPHGTAMQTLQVSREQLATIDWAAVVAAAPLSAKHVSLLPASP